jgi:hypothetical protein
MLHYFYKTLLTCALSCSTLITFSQTLAKTDTSISKKDTLKKTSHKKNSFKIGVNYVSDNVFMGRADSIKSPILVPEIKYTLKSGIYFSGSLDIIPGRKKNKVDGGDISVGWDFDITDDLSGGVSYSKPFYSSTSTQVSSSVSSIFNGNLSYDIGDIISPSLSVDYNLNKQSINGDVFINIGITHDFIAEGIFGNKDLLLVSPTIAANSGTQNFYDGYIVYRKLKNAKRDAAETKLISAYTAQLSQYKLLDYEFSVPIEYKTGVLIFQFTPIYAVAENQFKTAAIVKTLGLSNQTSIFYFDLGASLKF